MAIETERKFLVKQARLVLDSEGYKITQGYICSGEKPTVRIRIKGKKGYITIKGKSGKSGMSRYEWEKEIPLSDAEELMKLCTSGLIDKTRYLINYCGNVFEVDVFHGSNDGLIVAEIELESEDQKFEKPAWLGKEVTRDKRYRNSYLANTPYKEW
ncbi:MAG TPA: CYTH domain-containing protein [Bacteroidales bacterium]|nr:CYTH domain-containing protein [Bacteroidales bacterium]